MFLSYGWHGTPVGYFLLSAFLLLWCDDLIDNSCLSIWHCVSLEFDGDHTSDTRMR